MCSSVIEFIKLAFYHLSQTRLKNLIKHEHSCKILYFQHIHVLLSRHQHMELLRVTAGGKILPVFVPSIALMVTPILLAIPQITGTRVVLQETGFHLPCLLNVFRIVRPDSFYKLVNGKKKSDLGSGGGGGGRKKINKKAL